MGKLFISADIEGCAAVASPHALAPDRWEWSAARQWMTREVTAVAEAAFEAGYEEVIVADSHHNAHNIDPDGLPPNVWLVRSWPRPLLHMQGVEDPDVTACVFLGYHAGSGTRDSILAHSYHGGAFRSVRVNGEACSEGYLNAALAGEFGRSVVFVSGDQATVEDARRYAPEAAGFVAKRSIGWRSQMSLPPAQVREQLKAALAGALSRPAGPPFKIEGPLDLELEMNTQTAAELLSYLPAVRRDDATTVHARFDEVQGLMRFLAFAMLYSPTGLIAL